MEKAETVCARHRDTVTRLSCTGCGTPICPRCAVATPVGQKCPDCARLPRAARAVGHPRQFIKGFGGGLVATLALALVLQFLVGGFGSIIASFGAGYVLGRVVRWGAEGNRADPFRYGAVFLAFVVVAVAWAVSPFGVLQALSQSVFPLLTYAASVYGAFLAFR